MAIKIRDQGVGIRLEDQAHIFERFYRGKPIKPGWHIAGRTGNRAGFYMALKIIEALGGQLGLSSSPDGTHRSCCPSQRRWQCLYLLRMRIWWNSRPSIWDRTTVQVEEELRGKSDSLIVLRDDALVLCWQIDFAS